MDEKDPALQPQEEEGKVDAVFAEEPSKGLTPDAVAAGVEAGQLVALPEDWKHWHAHNGAAVEAPAPAKPQRKRGIELEASEHVSAARKFVDQVRLTGTAEDAACYLLALHLEQALQPAQGQELPAVEAVLRAVVVSSELVAAGLQAMAEQHQQTRLVLAACGAAMEALKAPAPQPALAAVFADPEEPPVTKQQPRRKR